MIVTFPHMGNIYIAAKILLDSLELDYVIAPMSNKNALEIGAKLSPEEMCLPFKIMMGNYVQSIEQGADTILLVSSCGPCRFGEYCELQMRILTKSGFNVKFILLDLPKQLREDKNILGVDSLFDEITVSKMQLFKSISMALKAINTIDFLESIAHFNAGYEVNDGESKKLLQSAFNKSYNAKNPTNSLEILLEYKNKIKDVELDMNKSPLKIALIGEIYTIIDPFSNLYILKKSL